MDDNSLHQPIVAKGMSIEYAEMRYEYLIKRVEELEQERELNRSENHKIELMKKKKEKLKFRDFLQTKHSGDIHDY